MVPHSTNSVPFPLQYHLHNQREVKLKVNVKTCKIDNGIITPSPHPVYMFIVGLATLAVMMVALTWQKNVLRLVYYC